MIDRFQSLSIDKCSYEISETELTDDLSAPPKWLWQHKHKKAISKWRHCYPTYCHFR